MNENAKTLIFVAVAATAVVLAAVSRPSMPIVGPEDMRDLPLYPDFNNPLDVSSLEIVEFDDERGEVHPLQVSQVNVKGKSRWSIPSHENYPADAKDQVASAAAGLMGLKVIEMVSDNQGDQREYGVVDPNPKDLKMGDTGVGKRVTMKDKSGKELLSLIVGKEVPGRPGLFYVRKTNQAPIYIVEAKADRLSTKFENWIERNLLGINTMDLKQIWIRDHSVDQLNSALVQNGEVIVGYDPDQAKWNLIEDKKYVANKAKPGEGKWESAKLPADMELNTAKLDELKTALDDLKIVDVARKPAGFSADLKASADITSNEEAVKSLARNGFFVAELTKGQVELFSNQGEVRVAMKDGVEYVLRFGEIAGAGSTKKGDKDKDGKDKKSAGVNRYLFVMADFNSSLIPKPKLEPLPEPKKDEAKKDGDKKDGDKKDEKKDGKKDEPKKDDKKAQDAERERVQKDNKRKQEEYDQKVAEAKKRVTELNARFADWYYVISDEVYRKIHLNHEDIFKKKAAKGKDGAKPGDGHADHAHEGPAGGEAAKDAPSPDEILEKMRQEGPENAVP
jgi:hypothetical protein